MSENNFLMMGDDTRFHKLDSAGTAYLATYTDVVDLGEFGGTRTVLEYDSLGQKAKGKKLGKLNNEDINIEFNCTPAAYNLIDEDFRAGTINKYAITFNTGDVAENMDHWFYGGVSSCKITGIAPDSLLKVSATIVIDGETFKFTKPVGTEG